MTDASFEQPAANAPVAAMFSSPRPDFTNPPVVEVLLSVQFEEITSFGTAQVGSLWEHFREEFPRTEDKVPLSPVMEKFDRSVTTTVGINISHVPYTPRCWFISRSGNELIQVQRDRFIFNWLRSDNNQPYPRYGTVRARFELFFGRFLKAVAGLCDEKIVPSQCEVTYNNHIIRDDRLTEIGDLGQVLEFWSGRFSDDFLHIPEDARLHMRYVINDADGKPRGRLHIEAEPRISKQHNELVQLMITARGTPFESNTKGVLRFFDLGREYVVRGFASSTTRSMHKIWGRTDV